MAQRLVADSWVALKWWLDDEQFVDEARLILTKKEINPLYGIYLI